VKTHSGDIKIGLTKHNISQEYLNICAENERIQTSRVSITAVSNEETAEQV
jgi:hypothetical protein